MMFATYGVGLFAGALMMGIGLVVWKMGEMRREFNEKLESLRQEIDSLKGSGGTVDADVSREIMGSMEELGTVE
ncbi:hypothetical protein [Thermococcus sp. 5-4]|uniref:hypothetical protein n=1 Tax=Thermococcus sp. 5-4 TaxID=2008440 RepID=UPI001D0434FB|nr:hypothetical protein [Thermococcus sp. 5-4]